MSKSLAELRAERTEKPAGRRPTRTLTVCLAPDLLQRVRVASDECDRLQWLARPVASESDEDTPDGPPKRVGGEDPAAKKERDEARAKLADAHATLKSLLAEMGDYEGEFTLRANLTDGEWRRWANEHPARGEGEPGHERDQRVTLGYCSADALIDHLGAFVHQWNSEPVSAVDWAEVFEPDVVTADKAEMATGVVALYESRLDFPRMRSSLSANLKRWSDSNSPASSASATSDSTAGSPDESTADTTATANA